MMIMNSTLKDGWMPNVSPASAAPSQIANSMAPATPMIERADPEGRQLGLQRPNAHQLRGDVHVADGHP